MAVPATSLDAVTVDSANPAIGDSESLGAVFSKHGALFTVEDFAGSGTIRCFVEVSVDGESWVDIVSIDATHSGQFYATPLSGTVFLALYIRARAAVAAGSPSGTVTGVVVSAV